MGDLDDGRTSVPGSVSAGCAMGSMVSPHCHKVYLEAARRVDSTSFQRKKETAIPPSSSRCKSHPVTSPHRIQKLHDNVFTRTQRHTLTDRSHVYRNSAHRCTSLGRRV